jgi:hypothetical protein
MANRLYYPLGRVPEFWEWLVHMGATDQIKMPVEMIEEIRDGTDDLATWMSDRNHLDALQLAEESDVALVQRVINEGYAPNLNDVQIQKIGHDPFLIAAALRNAADRIVVTTEVSKPTTIRANRRIPDVCNSLGIRWMDSFGMIRALDFTTAWRP